MWRWWNLSLLIAASACGGLDPIVSSDATVDGMSLDATSDDASSDGSIDDAGDAESDGALDDGSDAIAPFACGKIVCDSKTHYCEKKLAGDGGADAGKDGGVEVDTCIAYPPNCGDDGGKASCACITEPCACTQSGEQITVTCP